ncbi:hypothetical protein FCV25MIE_22005 [Fagus crenata]
MGLWWLGFVGMGLPAWVCGGLGLWWLRFVGMGLPAWICGYGFADMGLWWIGGGSVQCVVGLRVWWLSVVALCSVWVWWFAVWVCGYGGCGFAVDPRPCLGNSHSLP